MWLAICCGLGIYINYQVGIQRETVQELRRVQKKSQAYKGRAEKLFHIHAKNAFPGRKVEMMDY